MNIMMLLYRAITLFFAVFTWPFFYCSERGRARLQERYGWWQLEAKEIIWFHGASLGEISGLIPIVKRIKDLYPTTRILVSATSVTGLNKVTNEVDYVRLLPFDHPLFIKRALRQCTVRLFVCSEVEFWPALLEVLTTRNIKCFLINARMSARSYNRLRCLRSFVAESLNRFDLVLAVSERVARRYLDLGLKPKKLRIIGNSKYDLQPTVQDGLGRSKIYEKIFGRARLPVVVLGSLRVGEEKYWFPAIKEILQQGAKINICVVPRHKERFEYFATQLKRFDIDFIRWSTLEEAPINKEHSSTVLVDVFGELEKLYSIADLAFIGATLVPIGGHNPLEAAAYGACVVVGPHIHVISDVVEMMEQVSGIIRVRKPADCRSVLDRLLSAPQEVASIGAQGKKIWQQFQGATERIVNDLQEELIRE